MIIEAGQVAVVTGAAQGLGHAIAAELSARSVSVVLADVSADRLDQVAEELGGLAVPTDVRDQDAVHALADRAREHFGRVDMVVNNAGIVAGSEPVWATEPGAWRSVIDVNLFGVVHGIRAFVPRFIEAGHGHVVNIASLARLAVPTFGSAYGASKHAIVAVSEGLRDELEMTGATGVGVTVVCPGFLRTPMAAAVFDESRLDLAQLPQDLTEEQAREMLAVARQSAADPEAAARRVLEGVQAGHLHVLTNGDFMGMARQRTEAVLAALDWPGGRGPPDSRRRTSAALRSAVPDLGGQCTIPAARAAWAILVILISRACRVTGGSQHSTSATTLTSIATSSVISIEDGGDATDTKIRCTRALMIAKMVMSTRPQVARAKITQISISALKNSSTPAKALSCAA